MNTKNMSMMDQIQIGKVISDLAVPTWEREPTKEMARLGNSWNEDWERKERRKVADRIIEFQQPLLQEIKSTFHIAQKNKLTSTKNSLNIIGSFWIFAFEELDIGTESLEDAFIQEIIKEANEGKNPAEAGIALLGLELAVKDGSLIPHVLELFEETYSLRIARHLGKVSWDKKVVESLIRATSGPFLHQIMDGLSLKSIDGIGLMASLSLLELKDANGLRGMVSNLLQMKEHFDVAEKLLVKAGEIVIPYLIDGLDFEGPNRPQARAAKCLGQIGSGSATEPLIAALLDPGKQIENEAVVALGKLADKDALPVLLDCLDHKSIFVRNSAVQALNNLREQWTPEPFIANLEKKEEKIALFCIDALAKMKSKQAITVLSGFVNSENKKTRRAAEKAIKVINK